MDNLRCNIHEDNLDNDGDARMTVLCTRRRPLDRIPSNINSSNTEVCPDKKKVRRRPAARLSRIRKSIDKKNDGKGYNAHHDTNVRSNHTRVIL